MGSHSSKHHRFRKRNTNTTTTTAPPPAAATAKSAFFLLLPPELRIRILTAAFGGRTLHVERHRGCACRRGEMLQRGEDDTPARDACMREYLHYPTPWETVADADGWRVGAGGWLRVCRQA